MPSKHNIKRHHRKGANNKKTVKKQHRRSRHRRSQKKQTGGSTGCAKQTGGSPASHSVMDFVNTSGPALDDYAVGMELPSIGEITKCATQQMGGNLVSDAVMSAKTGMDDYQTQADLPAMSQFGGTGPPKLSENSLDTEITKNNTDANGPVAAPRTGTINPGRIKRNDGTQVGGAGSCGTVKSNKQEGGSGSCGSTTPENLLGNGNLGQKGGSPASDRLDTFTKEYTPSMTMNEQKGGVITPDMISPGKMPVLYQCTGGGRRSKGWKKGTQKLMMKKQRGGSFWNLGGCGPWNGTDAGRKYADYFSKTSKCPGPEWYANPPELPKAGSGDAADLATGATYPFA